MDQILEQLALQPIIGYFATGAPATEPTAIAALALAAQGRVKAAARAAEFLASQQAADGSLGVRPGEPAPGWPTSLAIAAWCAVGNARRGVPESGAERSPYSRNVDRACSWLLAASGEPLEQLPEYGHNATLVGWSWAAGTHSWLEPTAFGLLALSMAGQADHPRALEAEALLLDRIVPGGGWNYGNTVVLGQKLLPHVQPTGIALVALAERARPLVAAMHAANPRVTKSIAWLHRGIGPDTTASSLAWAVLGLKAIEAAPPAADAWLTRAAEWVNNHDRSPHKLALLALAAKGWPT